MVPLPSYFFYTTKALESGNEAQPNPTIVSSNEIMDYSPWFSLKKSWTIIHGFYELFEKIFSPGRPTTIVHNSSQYLVLMQLISHKPGSLRLFSNPTEIGGILIPFSPTKSLL